MKTNNGNFFVSDVAITVAAEAIGIVKENLGHSDIIIGVEWEIDDDQMIEATNPLVSTLARGGDAGVRVWKVDRYAGTVKRVSA